MKHLRRMVRKILLEAYELSDQDVDEIQSRGRWNFPDGSFDKNWPEARIRKHWDERGEGI